MCSGLCFVLVLTCGVYVSCWFDVRCYILYSSLILIYLPSPLIFSSLLSSLPNPLLLTFLLFRSPFLPDLFSSSQSFLPSSVPHPISFYTCRYFDTLIYIQSISNILTPHKLTEWMVEVCAGD